MKNMFLKHFTSLQNEKPRFLNRFLVYKMRKHVFQAFFIFIKWKNTILKHFSCQNEKKDAFAFKITCELLGAEDIPSAPKNKDAGTHENWSFRNLIRSFDRFSWAGNEGSIYLIWILFLKFVCGFKNMIFHISFFLFIIAHRNTNCIYCFPNKNCTLAKINNDFWNLRWQFKKI